MSFDFFDGRIGEIAENKRGEEIFYHAAGFFCGNHRLITVELSHFKYTIEKSSYSNLSLNLNMKSIISKCYKIKLFLRTLLD